MVEESAVENENAAPIARPSVATRDLITPVAGAILLAGAIVFLWFSPGAYQIFKAVHVLAAVTWVGGGLGITISALLAQRARDSHALVALMKQADSLGKYVFMPAALVVLAFGIAMVEKAHWGWSRFWIDFALAGLGASFLIGVFMGQEVKQLKELMGERAEDDSEVQERIRQILAVARVDTVILVLVVIAMVAKPTF